MEAIQYKGYTIHPSWSPFGGYDYFPTEEGMDEYNVKRADSIEEAKDMITEKIMTLIPYWRVTTPNPLLPDRENITKFDWIVDAVKFAIKVNGNLPQIQSI